MESVRSAELVGINQSRL